MACSLLRLPFELSKSAEALILIAIAVLVRHHTRVHILIWGKYLPTFLIFPCKWIALHMPSNAFMIIIALPQADKHGCVNWHNARMISYVIFIK